MYIYPSQIGKVSRTMDNSDHSRNSSNSLEENRDIVGGYGDCFGIMLISVITIRILAILMASLGQSSIALDSGEGSELIAKMKCGR
jgi:hypothetical protein